MAQFVSDTVMDKGLEHFAERAALGHLKIVICAGAPATYAEADTTADGGAGKRKTGETAALGVADFALGAGAPNGRAVTVAAQEAVALAYTGDTQSSDHAVVLDTGASEILAYTDFAARAAPSGDKLDIEAWSISIRQLE